MSIERQYAGFRKVLLGLGSNLGDRRANLTAALDAIDRHPDCRVDMVSSIFRTCPVDAGGGEFLNAAARISTTLQPMELLAFLKQIEAGLGRTGSGRDARPIDLDILFFEGVRMADGGLTIPHPRWRERQFVLIPLAEVCDSFPDPDEGVPLASLVARLAMPSPDVVPDAPGKWWKAPGETNDN